MKARNYWNKDCISWKEFTMKCERFLAFWSNDCCTAEDFCKRTNIDPVNLLDEMLDAPILDLLCPKDYEQVKSKCYEIYDDCYEDEKQDCKENYGWF